jgi:hypothetical protein
MTEGHTLLRTGSERTPMPGCVGRSPRVGDPETPSKFCLQKWLCLADTDKTGDGGTSSVKGDGRETWHHSRSQVDEVDLSSSGPHFTELMIRSDRAGSSQSIRKVPNQWLSFLASQGLSIIRHWR